MSQSGAAEQAGPAPARRCIGCDTELGGALLACPVCHRLVHADDLRRLAAEAEQFVATGDDRAALETWRVALALLPPDSRQAQQVAATVARLSARLDQAAPPASAATSSGGPPKGSAWARWLAPLGVVGLLIWKFKFAVVFLLGKGKLLLGGLTQSSTVFSMLLSLGVYWTAWGWSFAAGLVGSIYVHEMGHVAALRRLGIKASAPMFVPGLGAFVRLGQYPAGPREDARVGLAGPIWGLGAAAAAWGLFALTADPFWAGVGRVGAWINLFNLLPVWQLDGGRGFRALSGGQRWLATGVLLACWMLSGEGLLVLLALAAGFRSFTGAAPAKGDRRALTEYLVLVACLTWLCTLPVPQLPAS